MDALKFGMEGYLVKLLQYSLYRAGFDAGKQDGIFGRRTLRALQQFQREKGLAADGIVENLTWAALYAYITGYTLHQENGHIYVEALNLPVIMDLIPCSYLLTSLMLKGLATRFSFIQTYEIGRSGMGRPIMAVSMGVGCRQVGCVGPHRADQWALVTDMLQFVEEYASAYTADKPWARDLYETVTLHMVPMVNPDGVDLVAGAMDPLDSFYNQAHALAAYYPSIPFPEKWRGNIFGIDISLQYPVGWEKARRIRFAQGYTRPGPKDYVGNEPLIAYESRAVAKWTRKSAFDLVLSYDAGYTDWFTATWKRPGYVMAGEMGEIHLALTRALTLSP